MLVMRWSLLLASYAWSGYWFCSRSKKIMRGPRMRGMSKETSRAREKPSHILRKNKGCNYYSERCNNWFTLNLLSENCSLKKPNYLHGIKGSAACCISLACIGGSINVCVYRWCNEQQQCLVEFSIKTRRRSSFFRSPLIFLFCHGATSARSEWYIIIN